MKRYIILLIAIFMAISPQAKLPDNFTDAEKTLIGSEGSEMMRVLIVDVPADMSILGTVSSAISYDMLADPTLQTLIDRMLATVLDPANTGVGIAAPQVGISRNLILVQRFDKEGEPFEIYINPEITSYGPVTATGREGCLSIPGHTSYVERSTEIDLIYTDRTTGAAITEKVEGFTAVIFQHEIDHLRGILITDRESKIGSDE